MQILAQIQSSTTSRPTPDRSEILRTKLLKTLQDAIDTAEELQESLAQEGALHGNLQEGRFLSYREQRLHGRMTRTGKTRRIAKSLENITQQLIEKGDRQVWAQELIKMLNDAIKGQP